VRLASFTVIRRLLKHGIKIYQWQKEILHAKTCVIDNFWTSIGSYNLDRISVHNNLELNINIYNYEVAAKMKEYFMEDLSCSEEIKMEYLNSIPLSTKFLSRIMFALKNFL
jgi:cardiolipin synthase